jgi:hypothetical protein
MTRVYHLAYTARRKLSEEISRPDFHLRHVISHANLIVSVMKEFRRLIENQRVRLNLPAKRAHQRPAQADIKLNNSRFIEEFDSDSDSDSDWDSNSDSDSDGEGG